MKWLFDFCHRVYGCLVVKPIRTLFFYGPSAMGFWEGRAASQICAGITKQTTSEFWSIQANRAACDKIVEHRMYSFQVVVELCVYVACIWCVGSALWRRLCWGSWSGGPGTGQSVRVVFMPAPDLKRLN